MAGLISWDDVDDEPQEFPPAPASHAIPEELKVQPHRVVKHIEVQPFTSPLTAAVASLQKLDVAPGLEELELGGERVQVDDKAMINCRADLNQLVPFRYDWAWQKYLTACEHHWMPSEVMLTSDKADMGEATEYELVMLHHALAVLRHHNPMSHDSTDLAFYKHITNPECRQYILRHAFENAAHQHALIHYMDSTGIEVDQPTALLARTPIIGKKISWIRQFTKAVVAEDMRTGTPELDQAFLKMIIAYYVIYLGVTDYGVVTQVFDTMLNKQRFKTLGMFHTHVMSDRQRMLEFGILVVNQIKAENPHLWTEEFKAEISDMFAQATLLEIQYLDGYDYGVSDFSQYVMYMADKRASAIGLTKQFEINENPLNWMNQFIDVPEKVKKAEESSGNGGALNWD